MDNIDPTPSLISSYQIIISNKNQARWYRLLSMKRNIFYLWPYDSLFWRIKDIFGTLQYFTRQCSKIIILYSFMHFHWLQIYSINNVITFCREKQGWYWNIGLIIVWIDKNVAALLQKISDLTRNFCIILIQRHLLFLLKYLSFQIKIRQDGIACNWKNIFVYWFDPKLT